MGNSDARNLKIYKTMFTNSKTIIQGEEENRSEWYAKNRYQIGIFTANSELLQCKYIIKAIVSSWYHMHHMLFR